MFWFILAALNKYFNIIKEGIMHTETVARFKGFGRQSLTKGKARAAALLLAAVIIIGTVIPVLNFSVINAADKSVNYPVLEGVQSKRKPKTDGVWGYGMTDYSVKPDFSVSSPQFSAPKAVWEPDNSIAKLNWSSVSGAAKYILKIYAGTTLKAEKEVSGVSWTSAYNELESGAAYQIQITALSADGTELSHSGICVFSTDASKPNVTYNYTVNENKIYTVDKYTTSTSFYINKELNTGYTFLNAASGADLTFTAKSSPSAKIGTYLSFTAPDDGIYDYSGALQVKANKNVAGADVYSRIIKTDSSNNQTVIWPYGGEGWSKLEVTAEELNPIGETGVPQAFLKSGEKIVVQVYMDNGYSKEEKLNISLGNPTVTKAETVSLYKSGINNYDFADYATAKIYDRTISAGKLQRYYARWYSNIIKVTGSAVSAVDYNGYDKNAELTYASLTNNSKKSGKIGYKYYTKTISLDDGELCVGLDGHGVSFRFVSPNEGMATISMAVTGNSDDRLKYRLMKNGAQIYPNRGWKSILTKELVNISASADVAVGDELSLELYSESSDLISYKMNSAPSVTVYGKDVANKPSDDVFSALWERPYKGKEYAGQFTAIPGNAWKFGILENPGAPSQNVIEANYYNSDGNYLTNKSYGNSGYCFAEEELKFKIADAKHGMSLSFVSPEGAYYDFSTALNLTGVTENTYFRLLKNNSKIWPKNSDWAAFKNDTGDLPAQEMLLSAGETVSLQIYSEVKEGQTAEIGLGTVTVHKLNNRIAEGTEIVSVYEPKSFSAFEYGYSGKFVNLNSRYNYSFIKPDNTVVRPNRTDSETKTVSADDDNYIKFSDNPIFVKASAGTTAEIKFIACGEGAARLNLKAAAKTDGTLVKTEKNGEVIADWSTDIPLMTELNLKKGDSITVSFKNSADYSVDMSAFAVLLEATSTNDDIVENTTYYAINANASVGDLYTGKFKQSEASYWFYDFYNRSKDKTVAADNYAGEAVPRLYCHSLNDIAYYFGQNSISADINKTDSQSNGIALGFRADKDGALTFKTGLQLETEDANAKLKARFIKIKTDSSAETVWPAKTDWYEQEIKTGESLKVPFINVELNSGDKVYFEVYAEESNKDMLRVNLASPGFTVNDSELVENASQRIGVYNSVNAKPYAALNGYDGAYIPMTDRWNLMFTDKDLKVYNPDYYQKTSTRAVLRSTSLAGNPEYVIGDKDIAWNYIVTSEQKTGSEISFISPTDGDLRLKAPLKIGKIEIPGATVKYRVIKRSIGDSSETVIWPKAENGDYEILSADKNLSDCYDLHFEAETGDEIILQSFLDASDSDISAYLTSKNTKTVKISASVAAVAYTTEYVDSSKINYSAKEAFDELTYDSLWKVQYAYDSENPGWKYTTRFSWNYWLSEFNSYVGISVINGQKSWISNNNGSLDAFDRASAAYLFTPSFDGYINMSSAQKATTLYSREKDGYCGRVRITVNGNNVYPESGWQEIDSDNPVSFGNVEFEVKKGDEVRFEMSSDRHLESGEQIYINWNPSFQFSKYSNYYSDTGDIYSYLSSDMLSLFRSMKPGIMNSDMSASKKLSEQIEARKAAAAAAGPPTVIEDSGTDDSQQTITRTTTTITTPGDYKEWTEDVYVPGKKVKKTIRKVVGSDIPWVIIIIVSAVAAAGIVTVIILEKKGVIHLFRKKKKQE